MVDVNWAGVNTGVNGFSAYAQIYSGGIGLPVAPYAYANGSQACLIVALYGLAAGHGAARTINLALGSAGTGNFGIAAGSSGNAGTGWVGTGAWLVQGGSAQYSIQTNSTSVYFGRSSGATNTHDSSGAAYSGTLAGYYRYIYGPSAPQTATATANTSVSGRIDLSWAAPSDNGGSGVTSYSVWDGSGTLVASGITGTTYSVTGLTPGTAYTYTVRATNAVTDAASTQSVNSNTATATATGLPGAPTSLTATASTTTAYAVNLSWTAPVAAGIGGITGYDIYQAGTIIASTTGVGTTYTVTGLAGGGVSHTWTVRARNAYADSISSNGPDSNSASSVAPYPPSAPQTLTAIPDPGTPGLIALSWSAPSDTSGGITGYTIYYSDGTLISTTSGATTYNVTGLAPGSTYSFYVEARNAIADASGTYSAPSNTATATATGAPVAPTGLSVFANIAIAGRLRLTWSAVAGATAYNVYNATTNALLASVIGTFFQQDNLNPANTYSYYVKARNAYTDSIGSSGGASSANSTAFSPGSTTTQPVSPVVGITNATNAIFAGTYTITAITATSVSYSKTNANITSSSITTGAGVVNNTNTALAGTYVIASAPTTTTLTYAKTTANLPTAVVSGGTGISTVTDTTNQIFNGTYSVTVVDSPNKKLSYAKTNADITSRAATGTVSNTTNTVFNGTFVITSIPTSKTLTYAKTNADIASSFASGTVQDTTNSGTFNGVYVILTTPTYNTLTYAKTASDVSSRTFTGAANILTPSFSKAVLRVFYRSGWAG